MKRGGSGQETKWHGEEVAWRGNDREEVAWRGSGVGTNGRKESSA